jgi:hypothetical protein
MNNIISRDVLLNMLLGMMALVMLANWNPNSKENGQINAPGNLVVTITWPDGNTDVDLWLMGPGEKIPVGYSNKDGEVWNLLRDDTGLALYDTIGFNYENAFSRGLPPGEYVVNIHSYRINTFPMVVNVEVLLNAGSGKPALRIFSDKVTLRKPNQEITVVRFKIDDKQHIVPNSINHVFTPLRNSKK